MVFWSSVGLTVPFLDIFCKRPSQRNKFGNFWALLGTATYLMTNVSPEIKRSPKTPLQSVLKYVKVPKKDQISHGNWAECVKTAQYSKLDCFLDPLSCLRTNTYISRNQKITQRSPQKVSLTCYIPKMAKGAIGTEQNESKLRNYQNPTAFRARSL